MLEAKCLQQQQHNYQSKHQEVKTDPITTKDCRNTTYVNKSVFISLTFARTTVLYSYKEITKPFKTQNISHENPWVDFLYLIFKIKPIYLYHVWLDLNNCNHSNRKCKIPFRHF